jgi:hypothetical protein
MLGDAGNPEELFRNIGRAADEFHILNVIELEVLIARTGVTGCATLIWLPKVGRLSYSQVIFRRWNGA